MTTHYSCVHFFERAASGERERGQWRREMRRPPHPHTAKTSMLKGVDRTRRKGWRLSQACVWWEARLIPQFTSICLGKLSLTSHLSPKESSISGRMNLRRDGRFLAHPKTNKSARTPLWPGHAESTGTNSDLDEFRQPRFADSAARSRPHVGQIFCKKGPAQINTTNICQSQRYLLL